MAISLQQVRKLYARAKSKLKRPASGKKMAYPTKKSTQRSGEEDTNQLKINMLTPLSFPAWA
jgi:hypothetical protein